MDKDDSGSDYTEYWIDWFLGMKGNEYFCDIDPEYIRDRLTTLIDIITDVSVIDDSLPEKKRREIEDDCKFLYSLIHSRYILTIKGLSQMYEKYTDSDFGYCPREFCRLQPLLPVGLSDIPNLSTVKLYCPNCEDIYNPKSVRHSRLDGAFFGTSFPAMFFQTYPELIPTHSLNIYTPKMFGFHVHQSAQLTRWRLFQREKQMKELESQDIDIGTSTPGGYK
ncbi:Beta' regulatory subunit of casein kinase 2, a Ser/Thr protein kinase [Komagataella phaffii GS115]|uniref:Casein kinase II subunit beta n=1 Tax=Komagataella phaffii (strain GS115 / ATCC 20864) TaxID=644223 RepID=C4R2E3_KOMPG|nr:Beta' regulatory subunit of casein kinase 2, a Ser/Thr protein kinase [Komagataella phaffii GS115]CAY69667.1 Beta' regulatory subunit of casein kinase 2, a Ser/Thr protein kinase [Komagataella phaffii GS115]